MITQDGNDALDLSTKKRLPVLLSPPSSKRMLDFNPPITNQIRPTNKRPLRFQCKHCDYKAPSTSLMQNHIYRHTDLTPYACAYCGHKSTTKSTIMVHIELCHPSSEVKILENRVREQDFYRDLNSSEMPNIVQEPPMKKSRRSKQSECELVPINGVAISLKTMLDDGNEFSPASDEVYETDHLQPIILPTSEILDVDEHSPFKFSPPLTSMIESSSIDTTTKESESEDDSEYLIVYNRPKQYYGSLYEPDKQYACLACSYTTNHRPSMEDHVFVHTNERPYKCGYCGDEIHTRYAATYHIKYKHAGMPRNFIQNKADISQYYVNRAKKEEETSQFKVVDTRRVKVPVRKAKLEEAEREPTPPAQATASPDYRFLLTWSYYLATQAACLSPLLQQQGQSPFSLPTDSEAAAKFLQAMQTAVNPSTVVQILNRETMHNGLHSMTKKDEANEF